MDHRNENVTIMPQIPIDRPNRIYNNRISGISQATPAALSLDVQTPLAHFLRHSLEHLHEVQGLATGEISTSVAGMRRGSNSDQFSGCSRLVQGLYIS